MPDSAHKKGFIAIAVGVALLGTGPIFVKSVHANGILVGFLRMAFAGVMLTIPAALSWKKQPLKLNEKDNKWWALLGSLAYAVNIALMVHRFELHHRIRGNAFGYNRPGVGGIIRLAVHGKEKWTLVLGWAWQ